MVVCVFIAYMICNVFYTMLIMQLFLRSLMICVVVICIYSAISFYLCLFTLLLVCVLRKLLSLLYLWWYMDCQVFQHNATNYSKREEVFIKFWNQIITGPKFDLTKCNWIGALITFCFMTPILKKFKNVEQISAYEKIGKKRKHKNACRIMQKKKNKPYLFNITCFSVFFGNEIDSALDMVFTKLTVTFKKKITFFTFHCPSYIGFYHHFFFSYFI